MYVSVQYYFTDVACNHDRRGKTLHPDLGNDSRSLSVQVENGTFVFPARAKVPDARMQTWRNKMRKLVSTLAGSAVLALGLALGGAGSASAAMIVPEAAAAAVTPATQMVEKVEHRRWHRGERRWDRNNRRWDRRERRWDRRHHRRDRYGRTGIYLHFGIPGPRVYEPRPRRHYRAGLSRAHIRWCENRFQSYRVWDNTYQPFHGPRKQCWSPYS